MIIGYIINNLIDAKIELAMAHHTSLAITDDHRIRLQKTIEHENEQLERELAKLEEI